MSICFPISLNATATAFESGLTKYLRAALINLTFDEMLCG